jgi:hypothetical protein
LARLLQKILDRTLGGVDCRQKRAGKRSRDLQRELRAAERLKGERGGGAGEQQIEPLQDLQSVEILGTKKMQPLIVGVRNDGGSILV